VEARRQYPRVVHDEEVAGAKEGREVAHAAVLRRAVVATVHEQPGRVARLHRGLGDARRRQVVVEVVGVHGGPG
jgi:hypothetical protein